ncbi:MAG TPA: hypothetical protein VGK79_00735 [Gaiellaceae bacterium]
MNDTLTLILAELADTSECRCHNGVETGGIVRACPGTPQLVTLICEHEHIYDVALCAAHIAQVPSKHLHCPRCYAVDRHRCRHGAFEAERVAAAVVEAGR